MHPEKDGKDARLFRELKASILVREHSHARSINIYI